MRTEQAIAYFSNLGQSLRPDSDPIRRRDLRLPSVVVAPADVKATNELTSEVRKSRDYLSAKKALVNNIFDRRRNRLERNKETTEAPLTPSQQSIRWARGVLGDFKKRPKFTGKKERNARGDFVRDKVANLWNQPERLETALDVWKAEREESGFYSLAMDQIKKGVEKNWQGITQEQLSSYVRIYSREGFVSEEFADILQVYFNAPKKYPDSFSTLYTFIGGALKLVDDPVAIKAAAKIGTFETDILPRGSETQRSLSVAAMIDPDEQERANTYRVVTRSLTMYCELDEARIQQENASAEAELAAGLATGKLIKQLVDKHGHSKIQQLAIQRKMSGVPEKWLDADPVFRTLWAKLSERLKSRHYQNEISVAMRQKGEVPHIIKFNLPDTPYVIAVGMPHSLLEGVGSTNLMQDEILPRLAYLQTAIEAHPSPQGGLVLEDIIINGERVYLWARKKDQQEAVPHPLEFLTTIGFPTVESEDIAEENREILQRIKKEQRRFLDVRGVRVPLATHPELQALGYQHIDFQKDRNDREKIQATIMVTDIPVSVTLDKDFRFDFEGVPCDLSSIGDSLSNVLLSLLYPILCEENTRGQGGEKLDLQRLFISRMGYLGFLREGYHFSKTQATELFEHEGKDLAVVSAERKVAGETRNTTYYKPVKQDDSDRPPRRVPIQLPTEKFVRRTNDQVIVFDPKSK
ncbi:MAG: hypothetical protein AAB553_05700 [Patescibacteria group bacterium]